MALEIRTNPMQLSYNTTKARQTMEQPKAKVEGSLSLPKSQVEVTLPKVTIDQTQAFNESGLKNIEAFSAEYTALAKQKMQESIGRIASQGTEMSNIHQGGNPIAEQASFNAYDQFDNEFGMVTMPRSRPQIDVVEGNVDLRITEGELTGKIVAQKPRVEYEPGNVDIRIERYNNISIRYTGEKLDLQV